MFPLLGILFLVAIRGVLAGIVSVVFRKTRNIAAYVFLCPLFAALLSFALFWGGGLSVEHLSGATRWSTLVSLLGYVAGLVLGGFCGFLVARKINRHIFA